MQHSQQSHDNDSLQHAARMLNEPTAVTAIHQCWSIEQLRHCLESPHTAENEPSVSARQQPKALSGITIVYSKAKISQNASVHIAEQADITNSVCN